MTMPTETIVLAADFWDCECTERYIHRESVDYCPSCNTPRDDQPNSRVNEVVDQLGINAAQVRVLED